MQIVHWRVVEKKKELSCLLKKMIDDLSGEYGTGSFKAIEKKEITSYLMDDKKYLDVARRYLRKLM